MTKLFIVVMALLGMTFAVKDPKRNHGPGPHVFFVEVPVDDPIVKSVVAEATTRFNNQINSGSLFIVKSILKAEKTNIYWFGERYRLEVQFAQTNCFKQRKVTTPCNIIDGVDQPKARIEAKRDDEDKIVSMTVTPIRK